MSTFFIFALVSIVAFFAGVYFAPVIRGDYAEFKAYVESKLKAAEQAAKSGVAKL